ncbi:MAG: putative methylase [Pseudonocardiales bacterium]|jgi:adenine-specific DNA methylase|nr:putative methylase [Pseudonocardiales bacterium]
MTRLIERWFPCSEVSANSTAGWGSGNSERGLFTWFAARPTVQAKAALICSLLPWPDEDAERERLQSIVIDALTGRYAGWTALRRELHANGADPSVLDPFSGRGMIPLEAARLGIRSEALDYSPVAVLASHLLIDYPFRDWTSEPELPYARVDTTDARLRLLVDVESVLEEIGRRHVAVMQDLFPPVKGVQPWGYLWAVTLPCQECGRRFPLVGKLDLRSPSTRRVRGIAQSDPGQSFYFEPDRVAGTYKVVVHDGQPERSATLVNALGEGGRKIPGKSAICIYCSHVHSLEVHRRMTNDGLGEDALLVVAEPSPDGGKRFRTPTPEEADAVFDAGKRLADEPKFNPVLPAVPDELIAPGNNNIIGPVIYGARTFGDFMCDRQSLSFIVICRTINDIDRELKDLGVSLEYRRALTAYAAANMVRMLRYSTRGAWLRARSKGTVEIAGIFVNEGSLAFSYDFFEAGIGDGPGTWGSVQKSSISTLRDLMPERAGLPGIVERGTATALSMRDCSVDVVVTDPPYDEMIAYADSSDLFYSWIKRALGTAWPDLLVTADPTGAQEKIEEIIVKRTRGLSKSEYTEHRTREHYDTKIAQAFAEMRRVVRPDGVVTIVFGHGEPEVWQRLLTSMSTAGLVMTASWPASTESGGQQGKANIQTTLTMACRPAPATRPSGRKGAVETEIKNEIKRRYSDWERWGLAPADMLMAAAGPAMEVAGRYDAVLDSRGEPVDIYTFLPLARAAVQEAMAVEVDHHPLETFDARTRFALWWVRLYGRQIQPKSELRWQALASSMDSADVRDLVPDADKGVAFVHARSFRGRVTADSPVIDVALVLAAASEEGMTAMGEVLAASGRGADDTYLWAAVKFLADRLPDSDPDAIAFTRVLRTRDGISNAASAIATNEVITDKKQRLEDAQLRLL